MAISLYVFYINHVGATMEITEHGEKCEQAYSPLQCVCCRGHSCNGLPSEGSSSMISPTVNHQKSENIAISVDDVLDIKQQDWSQRWTRLTMMEKNTLTCRHQQRLNDVGGQVPFGLGDQQRTASRTASGLPPSTGISGLRALPGQQGTSFSFLSFFHVLGQQTFLFAGIRRAIDPCQRFRVGQHLPIFYQKRTNIAISLYVL